MQQIRIGADCRGLAGSMELTGVSQYTRHLLRAMMAQSGYQFRLFAGFRRQANMSIYQHLPDATADSIVWSSLPMHIIERLWRFGLVPIDSMTGPIDIFFTPDFFAPPIRRTPVVSTVHDLSFMRHPEWFPATVAAERSAKMEQVMRDSAAVIAVSHFTASELADCWPVYRHKVHVIHEAAGEEFVPPSLAQLAEFRQRFRLEKPFLLYVGTLETRKNIAAMIRAFSQLPGCKKGELQLILSGKMRFGSEIFAADIRRGEAEGWIRHLSFVEQQDLPLLYAAASGLCYLSSYEGFGLPPLEALSCGGRVLVGDIPVLREVLGDAACYADPEDMDSIVDGMMRLFSGADATGGLPRDYTWRQAGEKTLALFREVVAG